MNEITSSVDAVAKRKILIVDDEVAIVDLLRNHLEFEGYQVVEAFDGAAGIDMAFSEKPDAIILDVNMPKINGLEVCRGLQESEETSNIAILILSAYAQPQNIQEGLALGAKAYMTKPFSLAEVTTAVGKMLGTPPDPPAL